MSKQSAPDPFWIIMGGEYGHTWERVVQAATADVALQQCQKSEDARFHAFEQRCKSSGVYFTDTRYNQDAQILRAHLNKFGVVEIVDAEADAIKGTLFV